MVMFENVLRSWYEFGLLDVIIPFILTFTIVYGILQKTRVLGTFNDKPKSNINAMIAFVIGFLIIATMQIVNVITIMSQYFALASIAIMLVVVIAALLGIKDWEKTKFPLILGSIITIIIAIYALGFGKKININFFDTRVVPVIIGLLFVFGIIYYITRTPVVKTQKKQEKKKEEKKTSKSKEEEILERIPTLQKNESLKELINNGQIPKKQYTNKERDELLLDVIKKQRAALQQLKEKTGMDLPGLE